MEIHQIERCKLLADSAAVITSKTKDPRLGLAGLNHQIKSSEVLLIKETGDKGWRRMRPEEASTVQRVIATTSFTAVGTVIGYLIFPPVGGWIGGLIGLKLGFSYGGVGRQAPIIILAKNKNTLYVGALPLHQVRRLEALIADPSGVNIEFQEA